jgi:putative transposase
VAAEREENPRDLHAGGEDIEKGAGDLFPALRLRSFSPIARGDAQMPRRPRHKLTGVAFHVMNRAVRGIRLFRTNRDFQAFAVIVSEGLKRSGSRVRVIAFQVLDNHWHFVIICDRIADLSTFMHWIQGKHANKWAGAHKARGRGYVYQGRFKAVPVQTSTSLIRVCRYVERNALRKNLVAAAFGSVTT